MEDKQQTQTCPICGRIANKPPDKTYYICNWCGYKFEVSKRHVLPKEKEKERGEQSSALFKAITSRIGIVILGICFLLTVFVSVAYSFAFWPVFLLVWVSAFFVIIGVLYVLIYLAKFIIAGVVLVLTVSLIYFFATGQHLLGIGILSVVIAVIAYLMILGLLLLLAFLAPATIGAILVYVALGTGSVASIVAVIVFIVIAVLTYVVLYRIMLPFMIGYAICNAAGQIAYLIVTIGFSLEALQKLIFEGRLLTNMLGLLGEVTFVQPMIVVCSIISGVLFILIANLAD